MLSVDTNLLLRAFLKDEGRVSQQAVEVIEQLTDSKKLFIPSFVLLEFVWVLTRRKLQRQQIIAIIEEFLDAEGVVVGHHGIMARALAYFRAGKEGFSDYAILAESELAGAGKLVTFDQRLSKERANCIHPADVI